MIIMLNNHLVWLCILREMIDWLLCWIYHLVWLCILRGMIDWLLCWIITWFDCAYLRNLRSMWVALLCWRIVATMFRNTPRTRGQWSSSPHGWVPDLFCRIRIRPSKFENKTYACYRFSLQGFGAGLFWGGFQLQEFSTRSRIRLLVKEKIIFGIFKNRLRIV